MLGREPKAARVRDAAVGPPDPSSCAASQRNEGMRARGVTNEALTDLVRGMQAEALREGTRAMQEATGRGLADGLDGREFSEGRTGAAAPSGRGVRRACGTGVGHGGTRATELARSLELPRPQR